MIKKIDHIGIVVKDLEKSKQIYEKELHLEFVRQEQNPAFNVDIADSFSTAKMRLGVSSW